MNKKFFINFQGLLLLLLFLLSCHSSPVMKSKKILIDKNWKIQQSAIVSSSGSEISTVSFDTRKWYNGNVPSTIMNVLIENGVYNDIFTGDNLKKISKKQFDISWWYRKEFEIKEPDENQFVHLYFDGISFYANIWLNGKLIGTRDSIYGSFRRFEFDVTNLINQGKNVIAVEVFRQQPGDFGLGFVDWNPRPPDENMGIWREVYLKITGYVALKDAFVEPKVNLETLDEAWLTISADVVNYSAKKIKGTLEGMLEDKSFNYSIELQPNEMKRIKLTSHDIEALNILNPRLWWCNNLGDPNLYTLNVKFLINNEISDEESITFGIREIEEYYNAEGYKGFKLNGKPVLIKGAGWTDDIFLRDTKESNQIQIQYVKHMNLNTIRFENIWGTSQNIYDLCDKYGILVMSGWSCQWEWEEYLGKPCNKYGGIQTEEDMNLAIQYLEDQIKWLRNHPSIFVWLVGSDKIPNPELEKRYKELIRQTDYRPYLAAAGNYNSIVSGETGVKMNGPYEYVAPNYWYIDSVYGGAYGFNTETGPGPQIPALESIKKMIPEDKIWPQNELWNYHCCSSDDNFNNLNVFNTALETRYGKANNLKDYLIKAHVMNYEAMRGMFEAFRVNKGKTTGLIQWMLNSAWPSFYWQLYDYYLIPVAAYYATRKSNMPLQIIYNYTGNSIHIVNETLNNYDSLTAKIKVYDMNSRILLSDEIKTGCTSNASSKIYELNALSENIFLLLELFNDNNKITDNFYWLSDKPDEYAWEKTFWAYTPMKGYADFTSLHSLPPTAIEFNFKIEEDEGWVFYIVELKNVSAKLAFFTELKLLNNNEEIIKPVFWDDNYVSLIPHEKKILTCCWEKGIVKPADVKLKIQGWNLDVGK